MADDVDFVNDVIQAELDAKLAERGRYDIPAGRAGICEHCEEHSPRLINNACAPCRDKYNLG